MNFASRQDEWRRVEHSSKLLPRQTVDLRKQRLHICLMTSNDSSLNVCDISSLSIALAGCRYLQNQPIDNIVTGMFRKLVSMEKIIAFSLKMINTVSQNEKDFHQSNFVTK